MDKTQLRIESFQELYKAKQIAEGDTHQCASCAERRGKALGLLAFNVSKYPELMELNEKDHYEVIVRISETEQAIASHFSELASNPLGGLLSKIFEDEDVSNIQVVKFPDDLPEGGSLFSFGKDKTPNA